METKFIKYKSEQFDLTKLYRVSSDDVFDEVDIKEGTLVIGSYGDGKYLAMGYLRGITRDSETGEVLYEIDDAIECEYEYRHTVSNPCKVRIDALPYMAAVIDSCTRPIVGKVFKCNGVEAVIYDGTCNTRFDVDSIYQITPYFKEVNQ